MVKMLGKRAEKKSLLFVTVIFVLAVMGASMSEGGYKFGEEGITGNAVAEEPVGINYGMFGIILAGIALMGLMVLGFAAVSKKPVAAIRKGLPETSKIDQDIDDLSRQLKEIDNSFGD